MLDPGMSVSSEESCSAVSLNPGESGSAVSQGSAVPLDLGRVMFSSAAEPR